METEHCRIHPATAAKVWVCGSGTQLCYPCYERWLREVGNHATHDNRARFMDWLEKQLRVMCPGCAHEMAYLEDAQREIDELIKTDANDASTEELEAASDLLDRAIALQKETLAR